MSYRRNDPRRWDLANVWTTGMPVPGVRIDQALEAKHPLVMEHKERGTRSLVIGRSQYNARRADGFELVWSEPPDHPGVVVAVVRQWEGWSQRDLARRLGLSAKTVSLIESGKTSITPRTAVRMEYVLGEPASFWLGFQNNLDLYHVRKRYDESGWRW